MAPVPSNILLCMHAGNFPYVEPVFQYLTSGTVFATSIGVIRETAVALVQERRKEKDTEKVI